MPGALLFLKKFGDLHIGVSRPWYYALGMERHEWAQIGNPCRNCGHPQGAHESLWGQDLDEPGDTGTACRFEDCRCPGFID